MPDMGKRFSHHTNRENPLTQSKLTYLDMLVLWKTNIEGTKKGEPLKILLCLTWALTDSNRRPSACKADALNQLS